MNFPKRCLSGFLRSPFSLIRAPALPPGVVAAFPHLITQTPERATLS